MKAPIHFIHSLNYSHHIFLFKSTLPVALVSWSAATHACYGVTKSCNFCPISATLTLRSTQHPIIINRALLLTVQTRPPWCACARAIHVITWCTVHAVASLRTVSTVLSGWAGFNALWTLKSTWTRASSAHWIARSGTNAPEGELDFSETGFQKGWQNIWKRPRRVSKRPLWKRFSIFFLFLKGFLNFLDGWSPINLKGRERLLHAGHHELKTCLSLANVNDLQRYENRLRFCNLPQL